MGNSEWGPERTHGRNETSERVTDLLKGCKKVEKKVDPMKEMMNQ
jgi:hypothetical protein